MTRRFRRCVAALTVLAGLPAAAAAQGGGTITGTVTDRTTNQRVVSAQVFLIGTTRGALTDEQGQFRISNVAPGPIQLRVLRVGYEAATQAASVAAGGTTTVDFALAPSAVQFDRVVITATGESQRARERGNSIASVSIDSLALPAVQSFSDVLSSRAPGVVVQQSTGSTGGSSRIRIRGSNSVSLENDPLLIVDGVRVNNNPLSGSIFVGGQAPSRFNDLNPEDIENIEVIKGPAAAALYGTAAANGVIQVTTKRGRAGKARWIVFAELGEINEITDYPANFTRSGTLINQPIPANNGRPAPCNLDAEARLGCVPDAAGLSSYNPLEDATASPFRDGWRQQYGVSVSGGSEVATYYLATDFESEQGVYDVNDLKRVNLRANVRGQLRSNLDVTATLGYLTSDLGLPNNDNNVGSFIAGGLFGRPVDDPVTRGYNIGFPPSLYMQAVRTVQEIDRFTAGLNVNWQPLPWLSGVMNAGIDVVNRYDHETVRPNILTAFGLDEGRRINNRHVFTTHTGNGGLTATFGLTPELRSSTSAGVQYNSEETRSTEASGARLLAGTSSLAGTSTRFAVDEDNVENVTAGVYVQQQFAWRDRLFVNGAVRADDNSAFGEDFGLIYYPSASVSWVVSEESFFPENGWLSSLRLRGAYGESGQRPSFRDAVTFFDPIAVTVADVSIGAITIGGTGNTALEPERSRELEAGFEAGLLRDRIGLDFTWFTRRTEDALIARRLAPSIGVTATRFENLGRVDNRGWEAQLSAKVLQAEDVRIDLTVTASEVHNKLVVLGEGVTPIIFGFESVQQHREGLPLGAYFQRPILSFEDTNGDGLISRAGCPGTPAFGPAPQPECEIVLGDTATYHGSPLPSSEVTITPALTLFRYVKIAGLLDYRGGYKLYNNTRRFRCSSTLQNCRDAFDPATPLAEQARVIASLMGSHAGYFEDASFWKLRELSVTLTAPEPWARRMGVQGVSLILAGRNLKTWTDYTGFDPEVNRSGAANFSTDDFATQPVTRNFTARLNFTW